MKFNKNLNKYPLKLSDLCVMTCNPENAPEKVVWASSPELKYNERQSYSNQSKGMV